MAATRPSPYLPPRAPWYRPARDALDSLLRAWRRIARHTGLPTTSRDEILALLLPGYGLGLRWGTGTAVNLSLLGGLLLIALLASLATRAESTLLSSLVGLHAISLHRIHRHRLGHLGPWLGTAAAGFSGLLLAFLVYLPALALFERTFALPLRGPSGLTLVRPARLAADTLAPGDLVAFRLSPGPGEKALLQGILLHDGFDLAPVLALPGDVLEFDGPTLRIRGVPTPARAGMPASGRWIVPDDSVFVWPSAQISRPRFVDSPNIDEGLVRVALVKQDRLVGRPHRRWFHRTFPEP